MKYGFYLSHWSEWRTSCWTRIACGSFQTRWFESLWKTFTRIILESSYSNDIWILLGVLPGQLESLVLKPERLEGLTKGSGLYEDAEESEFGRQLCGRDPTRAWPLQRAPDALLAPQQLHHFTNKHGAVGELARACSRVVQASQDQFPLTN